MGLVGYGSTEDEAIDSLRQGVLAWCRSRQDWGELETTLDRRRIQWDKGGEELIIEVTVSEIHPG